MARLAGDLGKKENIRVYIVGGVVRDLVLNNKIQDLDLMVEGEGILFAKKLANIIGVKKIVPYEKFGTALIPNKLFQIEVASSRSESYDDMSRSPSEVKDASIEEDTEGLSIEYRTANGNWIEVIRYEVNVDANVDFNLRTDTYIADVTDSIQLGFRAYGDSSFFISSWEIDNVTVTPLPELTQVSISSTNDLDPTQAISGDTIIVEYTCNTSLIGTNVIIAGDVIPQENISNISGDTWQARYVVQNDDEDGPVSFVTMFKVQYDASGRQVEVNGNPKTTTTDNSLVVIDRTGPSAFELGEVNTFELIKPLDVTAHTRDLFFRSFACFCNYFHCF